MRKAPELLTARAHHSSTVLGSSVYVYGGQTKTSSYEFIERLDLESKAPSKWKAIDPGNKLPMLWHSGFCPYSDSQLLIFGGKDRSKYSETCYLFDPKTHKT